MNPEFGLGELALHEFARQPRTYIDAVAAVVLRAVTNARGQALVNAIGTVGGRAPTDPEFQVLAHTKAQAQAFARAAAQLQMVQPTIAAARLSIEPAVVGGAAANAIATGVWAVVFEGASTSDSVAVMQALLDVMGVSQVLAHTSSRTTARATTKAIAQAVQQARTSVLWNARVAPTMQVLAHTVVAAAVEARVRARGAAVQNSSSAITARIAAAAAFTVWASIHTKLRLEPRVVAAGEFAYKIDIFADILLTAATTGVSQSLAYVAGKTLLYAQVDTVAGAYAHVTTAMAASVIVDARKGSDYLNSMPMAYQTFERPGVDRGFARPYVNREFVSK